MHEKSMVGTCFARKTNKPLHADAFRSIDSGVHNSEMPPNPHYTKRHDECNRRHSDGREYSIEKLGYSEVWVLANSFDAMVRVYMDKHRLDS